LPYFPFLHKFLAFFYIQTFFYTIMNLFITLLENVNKSRTSANNVSLSINCIAQITTSDRQLYPEKTRFRIYQNVFSLKNVFLFYLEVLNNQKR
jgi:hypothetical protein